MIEQLKVTAQDNQVSPIGVAYDVWEIDQVVRFSQSVSEVGETVPGPYIVAGWRYFADMLRREILREETGYTDLEKSSEDTHDVSRLKDTISDGVGNLIWKALDNEKAIHPTIGGIFKRLRDIVDPNGDVSTEAGRNLVANLEAGLFLHNTMAIKDEDWTRQALEHGYDINAPDGAGDAVIHYAAREGRAEDIERLFSLQADIELRGADGLTPLLAAIRAGNEEGVTALLNLGVYVDGADDTGWSPLHYACARGSLTLTERLLEHGAAIDGLHAQKGVNTPLIETVWRRPRTLISPSGGWPGRYREVIGLLAEKGANLDLVNADGKTALEIAREEDDREVVDLLMAAARRNQAADDVAGIAGESTSPTL